MSPLSGTSGFRAQAEAHQALHFGAAVARCRLSRSPTQEVRRGNLGYWAPNPRGSACRRGHLTHRRTRQDQERPQLLLEAGQQQAQPTAFGQGVGTSWLGSRLLWELHVAFVLPGLRSGRGTHKSGRFQSPPSATSPSPPSAGWVSRSLCDLGRTPCPCNPEVGVSPKAGEQTQD